MTLYDLNERPLGQNSKWVIKSGLIYENLQIIRILPLVHWEYSCSLNIFTLPYNADIKNELILGHWNKNSEVGMYICR